jgi:hypothetical protein
VRGCQRLHDVVISTWEIVPPNANTVLASASRFLVINDEDRIITGYRFILA